MKLDSLIKFKHKFADGIYTRFATIQPGVAMIGKKHRRSNIFHLSKGVMLLWAADTGWRKVCAPFSQEVLQGQQRAAIALTEVEGANIFFTQAKTVATADKELFEPFELKGQIGRVFRALPRTLKRELKKGRLQLQEQQQNQLGVAIAGVAIAAAGLGYTIYEGTKNPSKGGSAAEQIANQLSADQAVQKQLKDLLAQEQAATEAAQQKAGWEEVGLIGVGVVLVVGGIVYLAQKK